MIAKPHGELLHAGDYVSTWLEKSGISMSDAAVMMGISEEQLLSVISGSTRVDLEMATLLETLTGYRKEFWLFVQESYNLRA